MGWDGRKRKEGRRKTEEQLGNAGRQVGREDLEREELMNE